MCTPSDIIVSCGKFDDTTDNIMKKETNNNFSLFLSHFPEVELPITLAEEDHFTFSKENEPLPAKLIHEFLFPLEKEDPDELTEYVPCFKIPETGAFHAIIYWKASLLTYEYILVTFNEKGQLIEKKIIAGTKAHDEALVRTVATITEDWEIFVVGGVSNVHDDDRYDPSESQSLNLELLPTGQIVGVNASQAN